MNKLTPIGMFSIAALLSIAPLTASAVELKDTQVVTIKAEVLRVDLVNRQLLIMELEGVGADNYDPAETSTWLTRTYSVDEDVDVLKYVRPGDKVVLDVATGIKMDMRKPNSDELDAPFQSYTVTEDEGVLQHRLTVVCKIMDIDKSDSYITFRGPGGRNFRIAITKGDIPSNARVGDMFVVTYGQGKVVGISRME